MPRTTRREKDGTPYALPSSPASRPTWRKPIFLINYSGDACVNIELKSPVTQEVALAIGKAAEAAFGSEVTLNQWWTLEDVANGEGGPWKPVDPAWLQNGSGVRLVDRAMRGSEPHVLSSVRPEANTRASQEPADGRYGVRWPSEACRPLRGSSWPTHAQENATRCQRSSPQPESGSEPRF